MKLHSFDWFILLGFTLLLSGCFHGKPKPYGYNAQSTLANQNNRNDVFPYAVSDGYFLSGNRMDGERSLVEESRSPYDSLYQKLTPPGLEESVPNDKFVQVWQEVEAEEVRSASEALTASDQVWGATYEEFLANPDVFSEYETYPLYTDMDSDYYDPYYSYYYSYYPSGYLYPYASNYYVYDPWYRYYYGYYPGYYPYAFWYDPYPYRFGGFFAFHYIWYDRPYYYYWHRHYHHWIVHSEREDFQSDGKTREERPFVTTSQRRPSPVLPSNRTSSNSLIPPLNPYSSLRSSRNYFSPRNDVTRSPIRETNSLSRVSGSRVSGSANQERRENFPPIESRESRDYRSEWMDRTGNIQSRFRASGVERNSVRISIPNTTRQEAPRMNSRNMSPARNSRMPQSSSISRPSPGVSRSPRR